MLDFLGKFVDNATGNIKPTNQSMATPTKRKAKTAREPKKGERRSNLVYNDNIRSKKPILGFTATLKARQLPLY